MKHIGVIVTVILSLVGFTLGYGKLQANQENTKEKVEEVKGEVKEVEEEVENHDDKIHELQYYSNAQSELNVRQLQIIDDLEKRLREVERKGD